MKQFLIFAVILLATLSMVNAAPLHKRETQFVYCTERPGTKQPDLIQSVKIDPDPIVAGKNGTFTIHTTLTRDITTEDKFIIEFQDIDGKNLLGEPSFFNISKPVPAGQIFETTQTIGTP